MMSKLGWEVLWLVMAKGYTWGWCCMSKSMQLVWMNNKYLGYRGVVTVSVAREFVIMIELTVLMVWLGMMTMGYRYLAYRVLVNVMLTREEVNMIGLAVLGCG